jgi:hypothetical protein
MEHELVTVEMHRDLWTTVLRALDSYARHPGEHVNVNTAIATVEEAIRVAERRVSGYTYIKQ